MKLEIPEIIAEVGRHATVDIETPCAPNPDLECVEPIRGKLALTNTGSYLLVRGDLSSVVKVECARCLKDVQVPVTAHIEEEFPLPEVDARGKVTWRIEDEPVESLFEDYALDVSEMARQHLSLAVPMVPLCDEACRGMCPQCGTNLNEGECPCPPPETEPRLAELRQLLEEKEQE